MPLKFDLDKFNLVLVQNKIFLSLTYFEFINYCSAIIRAVWKVEVHVNYIYMYMYIQREKLHGKERKM